VVGLAWYLCCRLHHHQELMTNLLNYHIGRVFLVRCVLEFWCGWVGVVSVLQASPSSGANDYSVELPHWSCVLGSMCVGVSVCLGWRGICVAGFSQPHRNSNTHRTKNT